MLRELNTKNEQLSRETVLYIGTWEKEKEFHVPSKITDTVRAQLAKTAHDLVCDVYNEADLEAHLTQMVQEVPGHQAQMAERANINGIHLEDSDIREFYEAMPRRHERTVEMMRHAEAVKSDIVHMRARIEGLENAKTRDSRAFGMLRRIPKSVAKRLNDYLRSAEHCDESVKELKGALHALLIAAVQRNIDNRPPGAGSGETSAGTAKALSTKSLFKSRKATAEPPTPLHREVREEEAHRPTEETSRAGALIAIAPSITVEGLLKTFKEKEFTDWDVAMSTTAVTDPKPYMSQDVKNMLDMAVPTYPALVGWREKSKRALIDTIRDIFVRTTGGKLIINVETLFAQAEFPWPTDAISALTCFNKVAEGIKPYMKEIEQIRETEQGRKRIMDLLRTLIRKVPESEKGKTAQVNFRSHVAAKIDSLELPNDIEITAFFAEVFKQFETVMTTLDTARTLIGLPPAVPRSDTNKGSDRDRSRHRSQERGQRPHSQDRKPTGGGSHKDTKPAAFQWSSDKDRAQH